MLCTLQISSPVPNWRPGPLMSKGRFDTRKSAQLSLAHWLAIQLHSSASLAEGRQSPNGEGVKGEAAGSDDA